MSIPFYKKQFVLTQPDGTELRVQGSGDQYNAVFETLDGFTIAEDPTSGFYHYATIDANLDGIRPSGILVGAADPAKLNLPKGVRPSAAAMRSGPTIAAGLSRAPSRWQVRRNNQRNVMRAAVAGMPAPPKRQTVGKFVGLCLVVQFADQSSAVTREQVDEFCNKKGYNSFGNNGSVFDYFNDVSDGKLQYTNVVAPIYTAKHPRAYYTNERIPQPQRAEELIKEALTYHRDNGFDFSALSADDGEYVYAVNVFYAGRRVNNWAKGLWPHSYHLSSRYKLAAGKYAYDYQITDIGDELSLGTFCHENGHMICDFPDLYDYGYESRGVGAFCLMCSGGPDEKNPTQVGAYLKQCAGWSSSTQALAPSKEVKLAAGTNEFGIHRRNGSRTEYFIVENRNRTGRDQALPGAGLAVWHVDELASNNDEQMSPSQHYECRLVQADGRNDLEKGANDGDADDLFRAGSKDRFASNTAPNSQWWDKTPSGLNIARISAAGASITFEVPGDEA